MKKVKLKLWAACAFAVVLAACEKPLLDGDNDGNVTLHFTPTTKDVAQTRGSVNIGDYFEKLNVQLFDRDGEKVFDKVKTQTISTENFGELNCELAEGTYTVVAVGHSSIKSATIKSPSMVQFTASDGEKLTDTFCHCGKVTIHEDGGYFNLEMNRVCAMLRFRFTDTEVPGSFTQVRFDYSGGSANFNPTTSDGTTKSTQSELRQKAGEYQMFTFPYMASEGKLKVTVVAMNADGVQLRKRTFTDIPVTRNRITTYTGHLFDDSMGEIRQTTFGISVNTDWDGEDIYEF